MSWRLSPCFSYCQLRCALQPKKKTKPRIGVLGVELESKFILKKVVSMTAHVHTWADNIRNEGKIATKCTPELTIWETRGKLPQSTHLSWQYEKWGDNRHDMTWHGLSWLDMAFHGLTGQHMCTPELTIWETRGKSPQSGHLSWQYEKLGDNRHDMTWHDLTWLDMTCHDLTWLFMAWHDNTCAHLSWQYEKQGENCHKVVILWNDHF